MPEESPALTDELGDSGSENEGESSSESNSPPTLVRAPGRPRKIKQLKGRPRKEYRMIPKQKNEISQIVMDENTLPNSNPTVDEALNGPFKNEWIKAMESEYNALINENAWEFVPRPKDKKIIGCKM